ncbi:MAG: ABC transporter substrate-binding protein [Chloroflexi bacterium]|nr:ABC transporter substrate-binding protein [Chloroflexota bacterium]
MNVIPRVASLFLAALVLVVGCAAPSPTATPTTAPPGAPTPTKRPLTKVNIVVSGLALSFIVPFLGRANGWWQEEGLDVDWTVTGGAQAVAAVVGGSSDFSFNSYVPEVIKAINAGQKLKSPAVALLRGSQIMVLNKDIAAKLGVSEKSSLADKGKALKGLTIAAFSVGGSTHQVLKAIAAAGGLDPERDLTVTFIGSDTGLVAAMGQKTIDGFVYPPPPSIQSVVSGDAIVLVTVAAGGLPLVGDMAEVGMIAQQSTITGRPDVVEGALRVVWRAERSFHQDVTAAAKALRTLDFWSSIDERPFQMSVDVLKDAIPNDPLITTKQFNDMVSYHNSVVAAADQTKITVDQLFDPGPAQKAKQQLGY